MGTRIFNAHIDNGREEDDSEAVPVSSSAERAVYVRISTNPVFSTEFYHDDTVMVDVDERGHAVGVEVLDALDIER